MYTIDKAEYNLRNPFANLENIETTIPDVNSTIKPIDREDANLEAEKGEIVFQPNGQLHKVLGKTHAKGGTPLNLPQDSFIFSNYKPLSFGKEEKELFKFKEGGTKKSNTPANLLKREIDIKHHNKMLAIQTSPVHDNIAKRSSELMLKKNFNKIGQVAYVQEEKKGFPDGLPTFTEGTAPLQNPFLEQEGDIASQYKMGGLTKFQLAGSVWPGDKHSGRKNGSMYPQWAWDKFAEEVGFKGTPLEFQHFLYNKPELKPIIDSLHKTHLPGPNAGMFDGKLGYRWDQVQDAYGRMQRNKHPDSGEPVMTPNKMGYPDMTGRPSPNLPANPFGSPSAPDAPETTDEDILPYKPKVPLTADQKLTLGYDAFNAANINKYYPKREQLTFQPLRMDRLNPQPYINAIDTEANSAYRQSNTLNPVIARAQNSQIYGKSLGQISETVGNVFNQNVGIANQEAQYNNQGVNNTANQNAQLDQTYYNQVQTLNQNFDNESRFARNRVMDQYNQYRSQNDALEMQLASQPTFGTITVYQDPKSGRTSKTPVAGWTPRKQAAPVMDYDSKDNSVYFTGAGINMNNLPGGRGQEMNNLSSLADQLIGAGLDPTQAYRTAAYYLSKSKNPYGR